MFSMVPPSASKNDAHRDNQQPSTTGRSLDEAHQNGEPSTGAPGLPQRELEPGSQVPPNSQSNMQRNGDSYGVVPGTKRPKRMRELTRSTSGDSIPEKRAKRIHEKKQIKTYTSVAQVVNRLFPYQRKSDYTYAPLEQPNQIRLLIVGPAENITDPLYCELASSRNEDPPPVPYEALSYMWGEDPASGEIKIFDPDLSGVFLPARPGQNASFQAKFWARHYIRPNLHAALRYLRHKKKKTIIWVDALCINQDDLEERSIQVMKMADIYNRATNVCIWLGEGNLQSQLALDFIPKMLTGPNIEEYIHDASLLGHWIALAELMRCQWFSRRWVVQEVALAKEATLHCGKGEIHWADFMDAVTLFVDNFDSVDRLARKSQQSKTTPNPLGNIRTGAFVLAETINNYFRKVNGRIERLSTLETLVSTLLSFEAGDPRDIIYAVLSMAKDTIEGDVTNALYEDRPQLVPDYEKPLVDVFKDFIHFAVSNSECLDIICRHWAPVLKRQPTPQKPSPQFRRQQSELAIRNQLPSWIPSVSRSAFGNPIDHLTGRMNGDSLVGVSDRKNYNTTPRTTAIWRFGEEAVSQGPSTPMGPSNLPHPAYDAGLVSGTQTSRPGGTSTPMARTLCNGSMFVKGFIVDVIEKTGPRFAQGVIQRESLALGGLDEVFEHNIGDDVPFVPDEVWRTMVADRGPDGKNAPPFYQRACQKCLAQSIRGDIDINKLIQDSDDKTMVDFLRRVRDVIWNRKFVRSAGSLEYKGTPTPKKLFGLAPDLAKEGDFICILLGCSVPVILREHQYRAGCHELIGEAYVYGMMDGEALARRKQKELEQVCEDFELR